MLPPSLVTLCLTACVFASAFAERTFNITELIIPQVVPSSVTEIEIECRYDADFTILTWFKGPSEFLRYKPATVPSIQSFPVLGIGRIDVIHCGPTACRLRLGALTEEAGGLYRCDLERERPPHKFVTRTANMIVHSKEHRRPRLEGMAEEYEEGDEILAYCRGAPGSEMRWYVNAREMMEARGSDTFRRRSSRLIFLGIPPTVTIQCAEFRDGNLLGSVEVKARWKDVAFKMIAQQQGNSKLSGNKWSAPPMGTSNSRRHQYVAGLLRENRIFNEEGIEQIEEGKERVGHRDS
ncbi:hypothetical protein EVAR_47295_1 [Eumeta japonica]|uniref:Ig-like domain-containing protein n=1 Tax=Eumeta variegata TaxID=151549 RepID=A0A4C1Z1T7_EUMVA|nr:hypothetical protein EVAR_47295_1 [Eumeta japonica]